MYTSILLSTLTAAASGASLPTGAISFALVRKGDYSAYLTKLKVGTPPQEEYLLVDTGSGTISFENPNNNVCSLESKPCAEYGTFDNTSSSTCHWISNDFGDGLIDFGSGSVLQDIVQIGDQNVGPLQFGYLDDYGFGVEQVAVPTATILGLALLCNKFDDSCYQSGYYLVPELYEKKKINRRSVSIYLGPEAPTVNNSEVILGSAYDKAKQGSTPFKLPMAYFNSETNSVNASAISSTINGDVTRLPLNPFNTTLIDTGNPLLTIPEPLWSQVMASLGNPNETHTSHVGGIYVDCKYRELPNTEKISYEFGGNPDNRIDVPLSQLVIDFNNGTCGADISNGYEISNGIGVLGDPFIRQTYLTFDFEDFTVTMAQARFTSDRDVVPFGN
ncbi:hypothetical protein M409DRAFT_30646 [Zasmidium cellare ATCC 36951]|uniref:Peptidase A1 domain-containing protein n=1 Tax=Zasmidium cellare ATCC 36951 TaxID=1080233 RepID=A0A6A6BZA2_ZASCE|nr:uncharacterized protein M409DRAFT_30646 [Zasmidium cellare ATCC 36951]KAF2158859.1 hypothetical protein M409DRAFT_30646 [Zasmidium cellare ATCC 36951]